MAEKRSDVSEVELLRAELAALRAELTALKAPAPPPPTDVPAELRAWYELDAQKKSQLVADEKCPAGPGKRGYELQLTYNPRHDPATGQKKSRPSEYPRLKLHAHNEPEARALYNDLCGIKSHDQEVTTLECVAC